MRLDPWKYPVLTEKQIVKIAENMIPAHLHPYYIGVDIMKFDLSFEWTAWNCDLLLMFKAPVVSRAVDGVRYAHSDLENMAEELSNLEIEEGSEGDEDYEDYDTSIEDRPVVPIVKMRRPITWGCQG